MKNSLRSICFLTTIIQPVRSLRAQTPATAPASPTSINPLLPFADEAAKSPTPNPPVVHVTCENEELAIVATNATLRTVLSAIQGCTGISFLVPEEMRDEKSFIRLGPSPTLTVLEELLDSTDLNFVIQPSNPAKRRGVTVVLIPRMHEPRAAGEVNVQENGSTLPITAARRAWMATRDAGRSVAATTDDTQAAGEVTARVLLETTAKDTPAMREGNSEPNVPDSEQTKQSGVEHPAIVSGDDPQAAASAEPTAHSTVLDSTQPSSPDSIRGKQIDDMQKMFEDRKKQMSNPAPSIPNPT